MLLGLLAAAGPVPGTAEELTPERQIFDGMGTISCLRSGRLILQYQYSYNIEIRRRGKLTEIIFQQDSHKGVDRRVSFDGYDILCIVEHSGEEGLPVQGPYTYRCRR